MKKKDKETALDLVKRVTDHLDDASAMMVAMGMTEEMFVKMAARSFDFIRKMSEQNNDAASGT